MKNKTPDIKKHVTCKNSLILTSAILAASLIGNISLSVELCKQKKIMKSSLEDRLFELVFKSIYEDDEQEVEKATLEAKKPADEKTRATI